jgi:hypothetical protein
MIYHISFAVRRPEHVAKVLAELTGATPVRAPAPPFPAGSWLLCHGDGNGSLIELLPWRSVLHPNEPLGIRQSGTGPDHSGFHALVHTPHPQETVLATARREGWRAQHVESGLFEIVKVWIDGVVLLEFLCEDKAGRYVETFGGEGLSTLDRKLRQLETAMAERLGSAPARGSPPDPVAEPQPLSRTFVLR